MEGWKGNKEVVKMMKSVEQGAATSVYAAVGKEWEGRGRVYLEDCAEARKALEREESGGATSGWKAHAFDREKEGRLWRDSLAMVGLKE